MKKRYYIIFSVLAVLGISAGIFYLTVIKKGDMEFPADVTLQTAWGEEYSFANMEPKVRLVEFMYTSCPDICPPTTLKMSQLRKELKDQGVFGDKVEFITITIDPAHDTPELLADYAALFEVEKNDGWVFLTGKEEDVKKVADAFEFLYRDPGTGFLIHSSFTYLVDEKNNLIEIFGMGEDGFDKERVMERIQRLIK